MHRFNWIIFIYIILFVIACGSESWTLQETGAIQTRQTWTRKRRSWINIKTQTQSKTSNLTWIYCLVIVPSSLQISFLSILFYAFCIEAEYLEQTECWCFSKSWEGFRTADRGTDQFRQSKVRKLHCDVLYIWNTMMICERPEISFTFL